jgi:hypothetical protein
MYILIWKKMGWATFWATFSQAYLVICLSTVSIAVLLSEAQPYSALVNPHPPTHQLKQKHKHLE